MKYCVGQVRYGAGWVVYRGPQAESRPEFYLALMPASHLPVSHMPALQMSPLARPAPARPSPDTEELRWYLVQCKPREDERALENLQRQGFECYRPARSVERRRHGRKCTVCEPLFPNYVFIRLNRVRDNWSSIRSTRGVLHLVRFNEFPLPVADAIIEGIRSRLDHGTAEPYLKPGERVRITKGAFSQLEGIFVTHDGQDRVVLLLDILQRNQQLTFPLDTVRKLG